MTWAHLDIVLVATGYAGALFPLTPALSLGEREKRSPRFAEMNNQLRGLSKSRTVARCDAMTSILNFNTDVHQRGDKP